MSLKRSMLSLWGKVKDEEMGKKDDDRKFSPRNGPKWHAGRGPSRRSLKRIAVVVTVAIFVYVFIHNIPTDVGPRRTGRPVYLPADSPGSAIDHHSDSPSTKQIPQTEPLTESSPKSDSPTERTYSGPPRFLELSASLHSISSTKGGSSMNKNVLFAASSLQSAAMLLPVACQMGGKMRNYVHFALISRSDIKIEDLKKINGIDESCSIIFHDARPQYASISTDDRMELCVFRAFHHMQMFMHPQAIIVDGSGNEEVFFQEGSRTQARATGNTLIELPGRSLKNLLWLTKLDSSSLKSWNANHIDILIHATTGASGSLIRLLKSLSRADYTSSSLSHLTIELPHEIDPPTKHFLETFNWPPAHIDNPTNARCLSLRHRIPQRRSTEEESSARVLESFWPANPQTSHILVLSPQVELSPRFFHYLKYTLLEYRYSSLAKSQHWDLQLFGISLEQPLTQLNGGEKFSPPVRMKDSQEVSTSFLWQAPTSGAMLFLGEKWMELHDFVSRSLEIQHASKDTPALLAQKAVSTRHPAWLEYALRLSRLRGYWTHYPGEETARNLATVHSELRHPPEEYAKAGEFDSRLADDVSEAGIEKALQKVKAGSEITLSPMSILDSLPGRDTLAPLDDLPLMTWDGKETTSEKLDSFAAEYALSFKEQVGRCIGDDAGKERVPMLTADLFCATK